MLGHFQAYAEDVDQAQLSVRLEAEEGEIAALQRLGYFLDG